jgi:hypothetical protein
VIEMMAVPYEGKWRARRLSRDCGQAPDDALDIAESGEIGDTELVDTLVTRSLEEVT